MVCIELKEELACSLQTAEVQVTETQLAFTYHWCWRSKYMQQSEPKVGGDKIPHCFTLCLPEVRGSGVKKSMLGKRVLQEMLALWRRLLLVCPAE